MTAPYEYGIDVGALDAIDFHTHVEIDGDGRCAYDAELAGATGSYFKLGEDYFSRIDDLAAHYRTHNTSDSSGRYCRRGSPRPSWSSRDLARLGGALALA